VFKEKALLKTLITGIVSGLFLMVKVRFFIYLSYINSALLSFLQETTVPIVRCQQLSVEKNRKKLFALFNY
jgi:hypothetical protein